MRSVPEAEGYVLQQWKRLAQLGGYSEVSCGFGEGGRGRGSRQGYISHSRKVGPYFSSGSLNSGMTDYLYPIACHNEKQIEVVSKGWGSVAMESVF